MTPVITPSLFKLTSSSPEYTTTDIYLAAFLCHRGARFQGLRRLGPKKVEFRFVTGRNLHDLLRLYWSGQLTPVIPWELMMWHYKLKCLSIIRPQ